MLSYNDLCAHLDLDSIRSLEDFLIQQCMYTGILKFKLDQVNSCVHVLDVFQRDVRPQKLPDLTKGLETMCVLFCLHALNVLLPARASSTAIPRS